MATAKAPHNSGREKLQQARHLAGEAATESAERLKARAKSSLDSSKQRAMDLEQKVEASVKEHPILSVGCAFAVGWVIAKLLK